MKYRLKHESYIMTLRLSESQVYLKRQGCCDMSFIKAWNT